MKCPASRDDKRNMKIPSPLETGIRIPTAMVCSFNQARLTDGQSPVRARLNAGYYSKIPNVGSTFVIGAALPLAVTVGYASGVKSAFSPDLNVRRRFSLSFSVV